MGPYFHINTFDLVPHTQIAKSFTFSSPPRETVGGLLPAALVFLREDGLKTGLIANTKHFAACPITPHGTPLILLYK